MKKLIERIHYVNNLWHIADEVCDRKASSYFKKRKVQLQNKLLSDYKEEVYLDRDFDNPAGNDNDMLVIRVKEGGDACHIPLKDIDEILRSGFVLPK